MANFLRRYQTWFLSGGTAGAILVALLIPDGDNPGISLAVMGALATFCAAVWLMSSKKSLEFLLQIDLAYVAVAATFLICVLTIEALLAGPRATDAGVTVSFSENQPIEALRLLGLLIVFLLGVRLGSNDDIARKLINALFLTFAAWSVISIVVLGYDTPAALEAQKLGAGRLAGRFTSPNSAGALAAASSLFALTRLLGYFVNARKPKLLDRIDTLSAVTWVSCSAALLMTLSRTAIAIWAVASLITLVGMLWRKISVWWLAGVCLSFVVLTTAAFFTPIYAAADRTRFILNDAAIRSQIYQVHFHEAMRHPFIGHGLGAFDLVNKSILSPDNYRALWVIRAAHNVYLQWFEETGALGLAALVVLNVTILTPILLAAIRPSRMQSRLVGILIFYAVFLIHGFTDYALQEPALEVLIALVLGCGFAIAVNRRREAGAVVKRSEI